jgi:hypothetical protein
MFNVTSWAARGFAARVHGSLTTRCYIGYSLHTMFSFTLDSISICSGGYQVSICDHDIHSNCPRIVLLDNDVTDICLAPYGNIMWRCIFQRASTGKCLVTHNNMQKLQRQSTHDGLRILIIGGRIALPISSWPCAASALSSRCLSLMRVHTSWGVA